MLYGVSMKPGGSSKVVTEKVDERRVGARATIDLRDPAPGPGGPASGETLEPEQAETG